jgi:hypothetical protein
MINSYKILVEVVERRDHLEDVSLCGRMTLKWICRRSGGRAQALVNLLIVGSASRLI